MGADEITAGAVGVAFPFKPMVGVVLAGACGATALAQSGQQDVSITTTVPVFCKIDGAANPAALNSTIPVSNVGIVDTTAQTFTVANVVCNTPTIVLATSMRGGVKSSSKAGAVGPSFTNIINYRGSAEFGTAKSTINTGTQKGALGPEAGDPETTVGPTSGPLVILIRPAQPTSPLIMGSDYSDILRITLTPQ